MSEAEKAKGVAEKARSGAEKGKHEAENALTNLKKS